jgi:CheY-like chemotaxis protein
MALFRRRRRARTADTEEPQPAPGTAAPRPSTSHDSVRERLRGIAAAAVAPEDAFEPALRVIVEASGARAGAICLFDRREGVLRLAAEVGLSDEGCRRLRTVRRADPASWDMPLNGLVNRRAYLIESASRNRYVPRLVTEGSVRTIACVPLYAGNDPVGSLILVAVAPRAFGERDVRALERAATEVTTMIVAARRRANPDDAPLPPPVEEPEAEAVEEAAPDADRLRVELAATVAERACLAAEVDARQGEVDRLRAALEASSADRARLAAELEATRAASERVDVVAAALAAAERERARLALELAAVTSAGREQAESTSSLELARTQAERVAQAAVADLAAARRAARAREEALEERAGELASELERLRSRLGEAEDAAEHDRSRLHEVEAAHDRLASELRNAVAREQRVRAELEAALRHQREGASEPSETARAAAAVEVEAFQAALARAEAVVQALEEEATRAHAEIDRMLATERALRTEQEDLAGELADVRLRAEDASGRLDELTRVAAVVRDEKDRLTITLRERESDAATLGARLESMSAERERLQGALATMRTERDRLALESENAAATQARLEALVARESGERARLAAALDATQTALADLERSQAEREGQAAERTREVEREVQRLAAECARLTGEREADGVERARVTPPRPAREPMRVVTVSAPTARSRARGDAEPAQLPVAVLDVDRAWEAAGDAHPVLVWATGEDVAARLRDTPVARLLVNLAAPGALDAVAALRASGSTARVWGCLADPANDRALALGMIEPVTRPLEPDAVVASLETYAGNGTRVVTAGADVDTLMSLRQALAREGMSVSMAWDGKQARELLGVVRPELVVVDLDLPRGEGYALVAQLAHAGEPATAVLVPGAEDPCAGFATVLTDMVHAERIVSLRRMLGSIFERSEAPPVDRRPKVRALGRK